MPNKTFPFKVANPESVITDAWQIHDGEEFRYLGNQIIPGWDYDMPLKFSRTVKVNLPELLASCDLPASTRTMLVVTAHCQSARYRKIVDKQVIGSDSKQICLKADLNSRDLSGKFKLNCSILLADPPDSAKLFSAQCPGSILFNEEEEFVIEGSGSRFPTADCDFKEDFKFLDADNADWHLYWYERNLTEPVMGALQVFLNTRKKDFMAACLAPEPDKNEKIIQANLWRGIAQMIIEHCLSDDEFIQVPGDYETETVGYHGNQLMHRVFGPTMTASDVNSLKRDRPEEFSSRIRSIEWI